MSAWTNDAAGLVEAARHLVGQRLSPGSSGNLSVRTGEGFLITPTGSALSRVEPSDLAWVRLSDGAVEGDAKPSKEWPLHQAGYLADDSIGAVVHLHSPAATGVACLPARGDGTAALAPYTPYHVMSLGTVPLLPYAPPGDSALAAPVGESISAGDRVILLANHGSVVAAGSLTRAVDLTEELEASASLALTLAGRGARTLTDEARRALRAR